MQTGTNVQKQLPYLIFYVEDLERSRRFYSEQLGLRVRDFPVASSMGGSALALSVQGTTILLMSRAGGDAWFASGTGPLKPDSGHCFPAFQVPDIGAFHSSAIASGVECVQELRQDLFGRVGIYRDPDGLLFSVVQLKASQAAHGMVLSGGGALGAFELGVMEVLARQGIPVPKVITGTSVGGFNAAVLACELGQGKTLAEAVAALILVWQNRITGGFHDNGVFRVRGDVLRLLAAGLPAGKALGELAEDAGFFALDSARRMAHAAMASGSVAKRISEVTDLSAAFSTEPLRELVRGSVEFSHLLQSPTTLKLATTDWQSGKLRLFTHVPRSDDGPARRIRDEEEFITPATFVDAVIASTAIPGVFPTVSVDVNNQIGGGTERRRFADGGLVMNTPLNPAIEARANTIHLICLNPDMNEIPFGELDSTLETFTRALVAAVSGMVHADLEQVGLVNRIAGIVRRKHSDEFYEPITIHRYHPRVGNLGGIAGLLDFSAGHVEALIQDGRDVTEGHDCEKAGCILPA